MFLPFSWLPAIGPLALLVVAVSGCIAPGRREGGGVGGRYDRAAWTCLGAAALCLGWVVAAGSVATDTLGYKGLGLDLSLDSLSASLFLLVSFIGAIVVRYSATYLDGDPGRERFMRRLCAALAAVLLLIASGNLLQTWLASLATSVALDGLLRFYPERTGAMLAARKKFLVSRLGDALLAVGFAALYEMAGSGNYHDIFARLQEVPPSSAWPSLAASCIAFAALLKSAQFPTHGWLLEVMETPTPVSALLHAGIVNAGGFLVLRFSPLIAMSPLTLHVIAIVGVITALVGSLVMLTQTSIKVSLAWSTIAQMGFMMLECGLGAYAAAFLHLVAHSLYKAHAFLSSGSVIDIARASWSPQPGDEPHPMRLLVSIVLATGLVLVVGRLFGVSLGQRPGTLVLPTVLLMGLVHLVASSIDARPSFYVIGRSLLLAVLIAIGSFALQELSGAWLKSADLPANNPTGWANGLVGALAIVGFAGLTLFQALLPQDAGRWPRLYALVSNGFYVNTLVNRLVLRFWPDRPPSSIAAHKALLLQGHGG